MGIHWRHFGRKTLQILCLVSTQCTYVPHCNNSTQYYYPVGRLQRPISQCLNPGRFYKLSITLISLSRQSSCTRREHPPEEKKLKSHYLFDGGKKRDTSLHQLLRQKSTELVSQLRYFRDICLHSANKHLSKKAFIKEGLEKLRVYVRTRKTRTNHIRPQYPI